MENYQDLKTRQAKELDDFEGIFFAFNKEQFKEGMGKIGLTINDTKQIMSLGTGGYIRKDRSEAFDAMFKRHREEKNTRKQEEKNTRKQEEKNTRKQEEKFLFDSLVYELNNHKYCITLDTADTLDALGYTKESIDPVILKKAIAEVMQEVNA